MTLLIHRNRRLAGQRAGVVTTVDGVVLGRVERRRRGSGSLGRGAWYWTATVGIDPDRRFGGHSLGTRYRSRQDAVAAIRAYHDMFPWERSERHEKNPGLNADWFDRWHYDGQRAARAERARFFKHVYPRGF